MAASARTLGLYRPSFATVQAVKIDAILLLPDGAELMPSEAGRSPVRVKREFLQLYNPQVPGYLVQMPDGKGIWASADFFECCFEAQ